MFFWHRNVPGSCTHHFVSAAVVLNVPMIRSLVLMRLLGLFTGC